MEKNTLCEARKIGELRKEHANLAKIKENNAEIIKINRSLERVDKNKFSLNFILPEPKLD